MKHPTSSYQQRLTLATKADARGDDPGTTVEGMPKDRDKPVVLSRIYTKTGDEGTTALGDFSRAAKTDLRLAACGDVDEANSAIGVAVTAGDLADDVTRLLIRIQNELFDVGADLSKPVKPGEPDSSLRIDESYLRRLEQDCDAYNEALPTMRSFVLPGGTKGGALLHVARTVVRRAERSAWAAMEVHGGTMNPLAVTYLNRLSDLLFILGRVANEPGGDLLWTPGGQR
jgi:cob(I)alamin adenosyltransferase